jgi:hypothetical protein
MFKDWSTDDWINHILFAVTILLLLASFILA